MQIHKKIREEVTELLRDNGIQAEFFSGRPTFINLDEEPTVIGVFLDEAEQVPVTTCDEEWRALLNIAVYHKSMTGEAELDDIAEQIVSLIEASGDFDHIETLDLVRYQYEQDTQQRTWFIANLQYEITYQR